MEYTGNVKTDTIIRTVLLVVALVNQILAIAGKDTLPIYENDVVQIISLCATLLTSLWSWWKNNSFTKNALQADESLKELKTYEDESGA